MIHHPDATHDCPPPDAEGAWGDVFRCAEELEDVSLLRYIVASNLLPTDAYVLGARSQLPQVKAKS